MRLKFALVCTVLGMLALVVAEAGAGDTLALKTQKEIDSYAIGVNIARNFKQDAVEIDLDALIGGIRDAQPGNKLLMSEDDLLKTLRTVISGVQQKQADAWQAASQENKKKGDQFLVGNKAKEGVVTLPSGLQYKVIKAGTGKKPGEDDIVKCTYRGTLVDGTEFGNSDRAGGPVELKVSGVIPGWQEALKLMPAGSEWQIFIPADLGYGQKGAGPIGPNETLIFDVALMAVK